MPPQFQGTLSLVDWYHFPAWCLACIIFSYRALILGTVLIHPSTIDMCFSTLALLYFSFIANEYRCLVCSDQKNNSINQQQQASPPTAYFQLWLLATGVLLPGITRVLTSFLVVQPWLVPADHHNNVGGSTSNITMWDAHHASSNNWWVRFYPPIYISCVCSIASILASATVYNLTHFCLFISLNSPLSPTTTLAHPILRSLTLWRPSLQVADILSVAAVKCDTRIKHHQWYPATH